MDCSVPTVNQIDCQSVRWFFGCPNCNFFRCGFSYITYVDWRTIWNRLISPLVAFYWVAKHYLKKCVNPDNQEHS